MGATDTWDVYGHRGRAFNITWFSIKREVQLIPLVIHIIDDWRDRYGGGGGAGGILSMIID